MKVVGIDPAIANGKPIAIIALDLPLTDAPRITGGVDKTALSGSLWEKCKLWRLCLRCVIEQQKPDLVAIEDARGVGGRGSAHLMTLVTLLVELCEELDVPVILINNQQAKSAVIRTGRRTAKDVAANVRLLVENADKLPPSAGFDYEAAVSVAWAGEALWRQGQMWEA